MAQLGDRVLARWPAEVQWWYPGVVCGIGAPGAEVQFDDGGRDFVPQEEIRDVSVQIGMRVYSRWEGGQTYYPGRIRAISGAALHIDYDDGDQEITSLSLLRFDVADLA